MRIIDKIIVHCTATPEGRDVTLETVKNWHTDPKPRGNGWSDIGYHFLILLDGTIEIGRPMSRSGAHVSGYNKNSIGVCYVGGTDPAGNFKDTRTKEQKDSLLTLLKILKSIYSNANIYGHRNFSSKDCPSFDAKLEYSNL